MDVVAAMGGNCATGASVSPPIDECEVGGGPYPFWASALMVLSSGRLVVEDSAE